jgi:hypothetical protein
MTSADQSANSSATALETIGTPVSVGERLFDDRSCAMIAYMR